VSVIADARFNRAKEYSLEVHRKIHSQHAINIETQLDYIKFFFILGLF
jgi:hypothetical protein